MNLYLDFNVYIECLSNKGLLNFIIDRRDKKQINIFYSPAHIEEIYRAEKDDENYNKGSKLMSFIDKVTKSKDILPSQSGLVIQNEKTKFVYERVRRIDTTQIVKDYSLSRFHIDDANYKGMVDIDKHNSSISNLSESQIWEYSTVKGIIDDYNNKRENIIISYNNSLDVLSLFRLGIDKKLPIDFCIIPNIYKTRLKNSHTELEYIIEFLMRVLNFCGYYAEKKENNAISSTHDTTHCIYATATEKLITMDKRFSMKCRAIYKFLGVDTQVIYCNDVQSIRNAIDEI